jgi:predicted ATPase with chaperone activity
MQAFCPQLLLLGPPGAGTPRLARQLITILPAMTLAEAIETTRIHRVAGRTGDRTALVTSRPFRTPHHTISDAGLIGWGRVPSLGKAMRCASTLAMLVMRADIKSTCAWHFHSAACAGAL